jgi:hypothetical protein
MMYREAFSKLEGVWSGTEIVDGTPYQGRVVFQTAFDCRFLLCDHTQTAPDRPTRVAHGVFRRDPKTQLLTATWFRDPELGRPESDGIAEGETLVFSEQVGDGQTRRTTYSMAMDRLTIRTDASTPCGDWRRVFEGTYRRR